MLRVLILLTTVVLLGSTTAAQECTRDAMLQAMEEWDRTEDRTARQAIAEALRPCMERQGAPVAVKAARDPTQEIQCAACGMQPRVDPVTGIWRPYSR
jgi:hypothetical protein